MLTRHHIIDQYLFFEVFRTWLVVAGVLIFLTLGLGFAKFIADAAAGDLPVDTVLLLALFSTVRNASIVLPISVLLAVLLTLGRLCRDNEMAALLAGGAGISTVYRPFITLAILVVILSGLLSLVASPRANRAIEQLTTESTATALQTLAPGRFLNLLNDRAVFYAQDRDRKSGILHNVFIRVLREDEDGNPVQSVITADSATQRTDSDTGAEVLVLHNGWKYEGLPGQPDWRITRFVEHGVRVTPSDQLSKVRDVDAVNTSALLHDFGPEQRAELQIRLAVPLSILILTLIALPLGRVPPRAGRYGRIIVGILLFVVYFNLLHIAKVWVQSSITPALPGTWAVHFVMLMLAVGWIAREQGFSLSRKRRVKP